VDARRCAKIIMIRSVEPMARPTLTIASWIWRIAGHDRLYPRNIMDSVANLSQKLRITYINEWMSIVINATNPFLNILSYVACPLDEPQL
jgi:hypothetical protein